MFIYVLFSFFPRPLLMLECMDMNRLQIAWLSSFWTPRELKCLKRLTSQAAPQKWLKICRTPLFNGKTMVSSRFSLKPIHWLWSGCPGTFESPCEPPLEASISTLREVLRTQRMALEGGANDSELWFIRRFNHRNMGSSPGKMMDENMEFHETSLRYDHEIQTRNHVYYATIWGVTKNIVPYWGIPKIYRPTLGMVYYWVYLTSCWCEHESIHLGQLFQGWTSKPTNYKDEH